MKKSVYCADCEYYLPGYTTGCGDYVGARCNNKELFDLIDKEPRGCRNLRSQGKECGPEATFFKEKK